MSLWMDGVKWAESKIQSQGIEVADEIVRHNAYDFVELLYDDTIPPSSKSDFVLGARQCIEHHKNIRA